MRACRYLLAVGLLLVSLPAAANTPATKVRPGDSVTTVRPGDSATTAVVRSVPDTVIGIPMRVAPEAVSTPGTTASVLSNAAAAFAILTKDGWGKHRKPCDDDDDDDNDDDRSWLRNNDDDRSWLQNNDANRSWQQNDNGDRRGRRHHRDKDKDRENCKPRSKKR